LLVSRRTIRKLSYALVGPYDELMIIPGKFATLFEKINRRSITACYVSNEDTLYNGKAKASRRILLWLTQAAFARLNWQVS